MIPAEPLAVAPGWRRIALGDVGSTNTEALDAGHAGDPGQLWVTGIRQLAGRGRRGRAWVSEAGNLYATALLVDPKPEDRVGLLPLVAALALHKAIAPRLRTPGKLQLKWPNDLLFHGAKVSGILLEQAFRDDGKRLLVIGMGVNCSHSPSETAYPARALSDLGEGLEPEPLFSALAASLAELLQIWASQDGARAIVDQWTDRAQGIGGAITVRFPDHEENGTFAGLDADGYLLLQQDGATRRIMAGDVFFGADPI
ncbi:MAG: biotin--[acetyl-CoA-carboxylase] ligase [Pseudomonadota bacterium]